MNKDTVLTDKQRATTHDGLAVEYGIVIEYGKYCAYVRRPGTKRYVVAWKAGGVGMGMEVEMLRREHAEEYLSEFVGMLQDTSYRFIDRK